MSTFEAMKKFVDSSSGHKEYFDGKTAACLQCALRFDLPNLLQHVGEDHTIVDIMQGYAQACFYIDDSETKKKVRYEHKK